MNAYYLDDPKATREIEGAQNMPGSIAVSIDIAASTDKHPMSVAI